MSSSIHIHTQKFHFKHLANMPDVPKKQMAMVLEKTGGPVEYKEIDVPTPGPDEVLVNIKYSGVCHTDLHAVNGDWPVPTKLPLVGGHEGAGVVVAKGDLVTNIDMYGASNMINEFELTTNAVVIILVSSGSTALVSSATSVNRLMSHSAQRPVCQATLLTDLSSSTPSSKAVTLRSFPRTFH